MKKIVSFGILFILVFSLTACGEQKKASNETKSVDAALMEQQKGQSQPIEIGCESSGEWVEK